MTDEIRAAMFRGDVEAMPVCRCCCAEHFHRGCPAASWGGCKGDRSRPEDEFESWERVYAAMGRTL